MVPERAAHLQKPPPVHELVSAPATSLRRCLRPGSPGCAVGVLVHERAQGFWREVDGAESQHYRQGIAALRRMQGMAVNLPGGDR